MRRDHPSLAQGCPSVLPYKARCLCAVWLAVGFGSRGGGCGQRAVVGCVWVWVCVCVGLVPGRAIVWLLGPGRPHSLHAHALCTRLPPPTLDYLPFILRG